MQSYINPEIGTGESNEFFSHRSTREIKYESLPGIVIQLRYGGHCERSRLNGKTHENHEQSRARAIRKASGAILMDTGEFMTVIKTTNRLNRFITEQVKMEEALNGH